MNLTISILDIKEDEFVRSIYNLEEAGISSFHIDVMDGKFTESKNNIDEMYSRLSVLNQVSIMKKDVHLMTYDLERNIDLFAFLEPDTITVHYEAIIKEYNLEKETKEKQLEKIIEIIRYIQKKGIKAGISINPSTDEKNIVKILPYISNILFMTVIPGKGGQKLIQEVLPKIKNIYEIVEKEGYGVQISADGGVNNITSRFLENVGTDNIIVGTYITKSKNYIEKIKSIKEKTMLQNTKEMLLKAKKGKYSVGAFNFTNLETLQGILEAAEEEKSPVILQTSSSAIKYMGLRIYSKNDRSSIKRYNNTFCTSLRSWSKF